MKYSAYRDSIKSGDLISWSHHGWGSWYDFQIQMVRAFCQSEYSHTGIAWRSAGRLFVLEAVVPAVRIFPLSLCESFYHISMDRTFSPEAEEFAMAHIGQPYSKRMAIKAFFNQVRQGDSGEWQCAKYVCEVLRANGIDYGEAFTPTALVHAALEDGKTMRYITKEPPC